MAVFIVRRETRAGEARFHVRLQMRRAAPQHHLGSFRIKRLAEARKAWAEAELAAGRWPDVRAIEPDQRSTMRGLVEDFLGARVDLAESTVRAYRAHGAVIVAGLGGREPRRLTRDDVQAWIAAMVAEGRSPRYIATVATTLGAMLDYAGVKPNPVREARKPRQPRQRIELPTRGELARVCEHLDERWVRVVRFLEATGARVDEARRVQWRDVDTARQRVLLDSKTRAGKRWVELPPTLLGERGRDHERVFGEWHADTLRRHLRAACKAAGVPVLTPHRLRHLHASRLMHQGRLSPAEIAVRLGHASPQTTLARYTWIIPPDD
jgi:integrase